MRIDVFSAKGGVGKTTISYRLANAWSQRTTKPVLLIDADLAGTCLGDLLEPGLIKGWQYHSNLVNLIGGRPEDLPEHLRKESIPVYELRPNLPTDAPKRVSAATSNAIVIFCPSHPDTTVDIGGRHEMVDLAVLQALVGHESAGGWVRHVLEEVIAATNAVVTDGIAGVVVDHGPGIGALQWAEMTAIEAELKEAADEGREPNRRAVFVTSRDVVDLAAARATNARMSAAKASPILQEHATWVLNRLPEEWTPFASNDWLVRLKAELTRSGIGPTGTEAWLRRAIPLVQDKKLADAYAASQLGSFFQGETDSAIGPILASALGTILSKAAP